MYPMQLIVGFHHSIYFYLILVFFVDIIAVFMTCHIRLFSVIEIIGNWMWRSSSTFLSTMKLQFLVPYCHRCIKLVVGI